jgi:dihydrofolate reductase
MWNVMTLDGCFEGTKKWDIDFHNDVWGDELEALSIRQGKETGGLLFGRVTYEGMADYWTKEKGEIADFMNGIPKFVFSRTLPSVGWSNTTLVKEDAGAYVTRLKSQPGKDLYIYGSADLSATFIRHDLIDEYRIGLAPMVLGAGNPLFKELAVRKKLRLKSVEATKTGCVLLTYERGGNNL